MGDQDDPIEVKQNDSLPTVRYRALQADGTPVVLTGATIVFNMRSVTVSGGTVTIGSTVINRASATAIDATNGVMEYSPTAGWSVTNGLNQAEFEATLSTGKVITFPYGKNKYIWVEVTDDIA